MVALAVDNTDRLVRLVNDILDIERMDSGHLPLERAPVGVAELVRQSRAGAAGHRRRRRRATAHRRAGAGGVRRQRSCGADARQPARQRDQVLAARQLRDGRGQRGRRVCAVLSQGQRPRHPRRPARSRSSSASSNQVDVTDAREKGGSGLGLAIARGIVESHGGHPLGAESAPGQGSTFCFTLPLASANAPCSAGAPTPEELGAGLQEALA